MVDDIEAAQDDWEPMKVQENPFANYTEDDFKGLVGVQKRPQTIFTRDYEFYKPAGPLALPQNYDIRKQWGDCIHPVTDQFKCSACWAFAIATTISDRFCIASNKTIDVALSMQQMISCLYPQQWGCKIGVIETAMQYVERNGLVQQQCFPYSSHNGTNQTLEQCRVQCNNRSDPFTRYRCRPGTTKTAKGEQAIKDLLFNKGPIFVTFDVYQDFFNYKKGIYRYTKGDFVGSHAVKVLGWGYDWFRDTNYFVCQNSWGEKWGQNGYFFMKIGEVNNDQYGYTCDPLI